MNYGLPTTAQIGGREIPIRTDFRVILDILECVNDPELTDREKGACVLGMFYPSLEEVTDYDEALRQCFRFIDGGGEPEEKRQSPRLMDWEHDFRHIIAPVNRVLGYEARAVPFDDPEARTGGLHWWTFQAAYREMGPDCAMSQIVSLRDKLARGKKLEKTEREWYRRNRESVDIPVRLTDAEDALLKEWT